MRRRRRQPILGTSLAAKWFWRKAVHRWQARRSFCATGDPERIRLLATYRAEGLRRMLTGVYATLRSAGRELVLELGERPGPGGALAAFREEADCLARDASATPTQRGNAAEALRLVASEPRLLL